MSEYLSSVPREGECDGSHGRFCPECASVIRWESTASDPGYRVEGCVKVPAKPRASAVPSVSALKPWSRNGNMRPRVTARWADVAPIMTPPVPTVARIAPVPQDLSPVTFSVLACDVSPRQRLANGETVRSTCRHADGRISLRTRHGDVTCNSWDLVEVHI